MNNAISIVYNVSKSVNEVEINCKFKMNMHISKIYMLSKLLIAQQNGAFWQKITLSSFNHRLINRAPLCLHYPITSENGETAAEGIMSLSLRIVIQ